MIRKKEKKVRNNLKNKEFRCKATVITHKYNILLHCKISIFKILYIFCLRNSEYMSKIYIINQ